jgi:SAM-dependent methyltransferase
LEEEVKGKTVIEIGSQDVNGSVRGIVEHLEPSSYLGVDFVNGPGVDEICDINDLVKCFGKERFDVVISTEVLEHVLNWRNAVSNIKNILKPNGIMVITTRSKGFRYHAYPFDFWRYEVDDIKAIFSDLSIDIVQNDHISPGVFVKARKEISFIEKDLDSYELYSIVRNKRCMDLKKFDMILSLSKMFVYRFLWSCIPNNIKTIIKKIT